MTGCWIYSSLGEEPEAFTTHRPFTTESVAQLVVMSKGAVGAAVARLIEHRFMEKHRDRRGFTYRLTIPDVALTECAAHYLEPSELGTLWHEHNRPLGEILTKLFA